ncbi:MAG: hypothetical protein WAK60_06995, partial [Sedimentisphaerales bacterium]
MEKSCAAIFLSMVLLLCIMPVHRCVGADMPESGSDSQVAGREIGSIDTAGNISINKMEILSKVRIRAGQQFDAAI